MKSPYAFNQRAELSTDMQWLRESVDLRGCLTDAGERRQVHGETENVSVQDVFLDSLLREFEPVDLSAFSRFLGTRKKTSPHCSLL
jgi:hypothetical protein